MTISQKIYTIALNILPLVVMIGLIPVIRNDYILFAAYLVIIAICFSVHYIAKEYVIFIFGLIALTISEYFFVSTGVETFERRTLFGLMPLWLPLLWAYAFVVIKRAVVIL